MSLNNFLITSEKLNIFMGIAYIIIINNFNFIKYNIRISMITIEEIRKNIQEAIILSGLTQTYIASE